MHLPPLQSPFSPSYYTSGEVAIAPDAVIAPGVVLKADPMSSIVIGAGVCLGLGSVLHAHQGQIVIEAGASLGAGVLVVGNCRIGTQACVGSSTTLHNASVAPGQILPPGSLLGETGRTVAEGGQRNVGQDGGQKAGQNGEARPVSERDGGDRPDLDPSPWDEAVPAESNPTRPGSVPSTSAPQSPSVVPPEPSTIEEEPTNPSEPPPRPKPPPKIYGKEQFERMRILFGPN